MGLLSAVRLIFIPAAQRWGGGPSAGWWRGRLGLALALGIGVILGGWLLPDAPLRQPFRLPPPHCFATGRMGLLSAVRLIFIPAAQRRGGGPSAGWWRGRLGLAQFPGIGVILGGWLLPHPPLRQPFRLPPPHCFATGRKVGGFCRSTDFPPCRAAVGRGTIRRMVEGFEQAFLQVLACGICPSGSLIIQSHCPLSAKAERERPSLPAAFPFSPRSALLMRN
jgi:hypothetical protein